MGEVDHAINYRAGVLGCKWGDEARVVRGEGRKKRDAR
jgi:hypothetical protein